VLKPGGEIILVSRVGAEAGLRKTIEHWFQPIVRKLGWRTDSPGRGLRSGPRCARAST